METRKEGKKKRSNTRKITTSKGEREKKRWSGTQGDTKK